MICLRFATIYFLLVEVVIKAKIISMRGKKFLQSQEIISKWGMTNLPSLKYKKSSYFEEKCFEFGKISLLKVQIKY